ncbi:S41 family peptidase [Qipengyuania sp. MTN3-11]|uniref:S41 family peptidase n=1 Tax=Qipengyuania sp. MTN3-11 TaxID=3056557 RepID=UPI0036F1B014
MIGIRRIFAGLLLVLAWDANAQPSDDCANCFTAAEAQEDLRILYQRLQEEHVDLFARRRKTDYDAQIDRLGAQIDRPIPKYKFRLLLHKAMAFGEIGHAKTEAALEDVFAHVGAGGGIIPLSIVYREEAMLTDNWTGTSEALPPGSRITGLGGMPTADFEAEVRKLVSADTTRLLRAQIELGLPAYLYLVFGPRDALTVQFVTPDGNSGTHDVAAMPLGEMYALHDERPVERPDRNANARVYRDLGDGLFYLQPGPFSATSEERGEDGAAYTIGPFREFVAQAFAALANSGARDLIVDLRGNGGGDASFSDLIIARLTDQPYRHSARYEIRAGPNTKAVWAGRDANPETLSGRIAAALRTAADGERVSIDLPAIQPITDDGFNGRVWVLVDRHSFSNAAVVAALMQDLDIAAVMGEETADVPTTYGAVESFALPNSGASIVYPKAYMVRPSGSEAIRGVVPDFPIPPNPIGSARDTVLEAAIKEIKREDRSS